MNNKKIKGSGILVVILSSIALVIYSSISFSESQHFNNLLERYIDNNKAYYEKYVDDVDTYYNYVLSIKYSKK